MENKPDLTNTRTAWSLIDDIMVPFGGKFFVIDKAIYRITQTDRLANRVQLSIYCNLPSPVRLAVQLLSDLCSSNGLSSDFDKIERRLYDLDNAYALTHLGSIWVTSDFFYLHRNEIVSTINSLTHLNRGSIYA